VEVEELQLELAPKLGGREHPLHPLKLHASQPLERAELRWEAALASSPKFGGQECPSNSPKLHLLELLLEVLELQWEPAAKPGGHEQPVRHPLHPLELHASQPLEPLGEALLLLSASTVALELSWEAALPPR